MATMVNMDKQTINQLMASIVDADDMPQQNTVDNSILDNVPDQLWTKHPTDVGLMTSAGQVLIQLKPTSEKTISTHHCPNSWH